MVPSIVKLLVLQWEADLALACLFVGHQEQLIWNSYTRPKPSFVRRYIDDVIGATSLSLEDVKQFNNYTKDFDPVLKFTSTIIENSLPFLDILLKI